MVAPLVSFIIPVYNREALIGETLDSILTQTYTNWECIVVDDHSTDQTCEVVKNFCKKDPRVLLLKRPKARLKGANACRNFGYENCHGKYINWFDSDDLMFPEKLERQVNALEENPSMPFTVCQTLVFEGHKENVLGLRKEKIYSDDFFNDFITNDIKWLTQAPLLKKSFLKNNLLQFDESLAKAQERDFFVKVLSCIKEYHYDNHPYVLFRKHTNNISFGKMTEAKYESTFNVNHGILLIYKTKLTNRAIHYLLQNLKSDINKSVRAKYYRQAKEFLDKLFQLELLTFKERVKLKLGMLSVRFFKKGDLLFK